MKGGSTNESISKGISSYTMDASPYTMKGGATIAETQTWLDNTIRELEEYKKPNSELVQRIIIKNDKYIMLKFEELPKGPSITMKDRDKMIDDDISDMINRHVTAISKVIKQIQEKGIRITIPPFNARSGQAYIKALLNARQPKSLLERFGRSTTSKYIPRYEISDDMTQYILVN